MEFYVNDSGDKNNCMTLFPALEKFTLHRLRGVKEWVDIEATIPVFPSLKELMIEYCGNLSRVPVLSRLSSLEILSLRDCDELISIGDGLFPSSLKELEIEGCRKLRSIPSIEGGIFLQVLHVKWCDELSKIEEGLLASTCLRDVEIGDCPNLISVPIIEGSFSLLTLRLNKGKGFTSLPTEGEDGRKPEAGASGTQEEEAVKNKSEPDVEPLIEMSSPTRKDDSDQRPVPDKAEVMREAEVTPSLVQEVDSPYPVSVDVEVAEKPLSATTTEREPSLPSTAENLDIVPDENEWMFSETVASESLTAEIQEIVPDENEGMLSSHEIETEATHFRKEEDNKVVHGSRCQSIK
ncbi:hypothetical protein PTKIN_Ptkin09bG0225800 [Pterospermum kingtungense]